MSHNLCRGVAKLVKALDFDSSMRGFESFLPCQTIQGTVTRARFSSSPRPRTRLRFLSAVPLLSREAFPLRSP
jgi:hypothetical protein